MSGNPNDDIRDDMNTPTVVAAPGQTADHVIQSSDTRVQRALVDVQLAAANELNARLQVQLLQQQANIVQLQHDLTQLRDLTDNLIRSTLCARCSTRHDLRLCAWCRVARYCSRACQSQDWEFHRHTCGAPHLGADWFEHGP